MDPESLREVLTAPPQPRVDGRQSAAALAIARGTMRLLRDAGFACLPELSLASGRRADIAAMDAKGAIWIIEIKSCADDFRSDRKWTDYRAHCDALLFAVDCDFPQLLLPSDAGLIVADAYGARLVREAPLHRLSATTRRATALRFARAAASRLHALTDTAAAELD